MKSTQLSWHRQVIYGSPVGCLRQSEWHTEAMLHADEQMDSSVPLMPSCADESVIRVDMRTIAAAAKRPECAARLRWAAIVVIDTLHASSVVVLPRTSFTSGVRTDLPWPHSLLYPALGEV